MTEQRLFIRQPTASSIIIKIQSASGLTQQGTVRYRLLTHLKKGETKLSLLCLPSVIQPTVSVYSIDGCSFQTYCQNLKMTIVRQSPFLSFIFTVIVIAQSASANHRLEASAQLSLDITNICILPTFCLKLDPQNNGDLHFFPLQERLL